MIFSLLLWFAAWRIRLKLFFVFRKHPNLLNDLLNENISLQIQTSDKTSSRCFILEYGVFKSFKKELIDPGIKVIFPNGKIAREVFKAMRQDKSQIFTFIQEKKVTIEGDFSILQKLFLLKEKIDENSNAA